MRYTTETIDRKIVGQYTGKHIAGTSERVFDAAAMIEYRFDGFIITVSRVPVHWDEEQQRQYISGKVGIEMNRRVQEIAAMLQRQRKNTIVQGQITEQQEQCQDTYERIARTLARCANVRISFEATEPIQTAA
ncbi:MAG: hypothetical protein M3Y58_09980 [Chloroflexota bacterium]|nr:hypothetical protein [Chloroflexota bacterium]